MSRPRILIIDDDELIRSLLSRTLVDEGFLVSLAADGREGLRLYLADPADILITDIRMPEMDGLELIMAIRNANHEAKIIAMSGAGRQSDPQFLKMSETFGAATIMPKPFDPEDLVRLVHELLNTSDSVPDQQTRGL